MKRKERSYKTKEKEFNDKKEVAPTRLLETSEYRKRNYIIPQKTFLDGCASELK